MFHLFFAPFYAAHYSYLQLRAHSTYVSPISLIVVPTIKKMAMGLVGGVAGEWTGLLWVGVYCWRPCFVVLGVWQFVTTMRHLLQIAWQIYNVANRRRKQTGNTLCEVLMFCARNYARKRVNDSLNLNHKSKTKKKGFPS